MRERAFGDRDGPPPPEALLIELRGTPGQDPCVDETAECLQTGILRRTGYACFSQNNGRREGYDLRVEV